MTKEGEAVSDEVPRGGCLHGDAAWVWGFGSSMQVAKEYLRPQTSSSDVALQT
jgi:hypothetical protein